MFSKFLTRKQFEKVDFEIAKTLCNMHKNDQDKIQKIFENAIEEFKGLDPEKVSLIFFSMAVVYEGRRIQT